jgi:hypothetical protein
LGCVQSTLAMLSLDSSPQQEQPLHQMTVSVEVHVGRSRITHGATANRQLIEEPDQYRKVNTADMAGDTGLLECPMCDFNVLQTDDYVLQLHFEQVHTTDSPFRIEGDDASPPPSAPLRPSSKRKHAGDTPSADEEESTVTCPEPDCGELVLLTDFNDHLDYHAAETLSFDEATGKYHSHHSSATMQGLATYHSQAEYSSSTDLPDASKRSDGHARGHKSKKHGHRHRSNTNSSEKSTLSRSILSFNPFVKFDKSVKPPNKSARLGVSDLSLISPHMLMVCRNPSLVPMLGKSACPDGYTISSLRARR